MTTTSAASTPGDAWSRRLPYSHPASQEALSIPPAPRGRILVVEDKAIIALDIQRALREAGYRVVGPAATLQDIQRLIDRGSIDCAILDVDVDRRTPLPVADLLAFADVPFVFLTAGGRADLPQQHRQRPVVEKPFAIAELVASIQKAMADSPAASCSALEMSPAPWPRIYPPI